jgi:hypothetical protein
MPLILAASAVFFNCSRVKAPVDPFWTAVKSLLELVVMVILASMHASSSAVGSNITVSPTLAAVMDIGIVVSGGSWTSPESITLPS